MCNRGHLLALVLPLVASACRSQPAREAERVEKALSWVATAGAVTRAWAENRVPARYVERTLDEARRTLERMGEPAAVRITAALDTAVRRRDREAVSAPLAALVTEWSALAARAEALRGTR